ncbi:MAG: hypothetical protein ACFB22_10250 [Rhodothalassiaceae bacterium]
MDERCDTRDIVNMGETIRLRDLAAYIAQAERQLHCQQRAAAHR